MNLNLQQTLEKANVDYESLLSRYPSRHYKVYKIPKRSFGFRTIAQPTPEVKRIQRELVSILEKLVEVHPSATAYVKGLSIRDNAAVHVNSEYLLKLDLEEFFNSITPKMLFSALANQNIQLKVKDKRILEQFLFWSIRRRVNSRLVLSVGAPSSPFISNIVMYSFDKKMEEMCSAKRINYTRYADDLTFSTKEKGILFSHLNDVRSMLKQEFDTWISLNSSKTVFSSKAHNRHVTGVTITNTNKLSLGRERKRYISALIHKYKNEALCEEDVLHLKGLIAHAQHIEPAFLAVMDRKYGPGIVSSIKKFRLG